MGKRDDKGPVVAFFDVDGTLVYRTKESGPGTLVRPLVAEMVTRFASSGGIPVLSTGRSMCGVAEVSHQIPFRGFITMDGAHVRLGETVVFDKCFPRCLLERVVSEMNAVNMSAYFQGTEVCAQVSPDGRNPFGSEGVETARDIADLARIKPDLRFGKIDFFGIDYERYRASDFLLRKLTYYDVADGCHELVMPGVDKGMGAQRFLEALERLCGSAPSRVYAFGDSENDVSLFDVADEAIAMGQASDKVKARATYITDSCEDNGVASALRHFGLA